MILGDRHVPAGVNADSWQRLAAAQQPDWPDPVALRAVADELRTAPPLIFASECDRLRARMAMVARGEGFLLQGGDCAETFDGITPSQVRGKLHTLSQMALVLEYASSLPVVKMGRIAGQFSKPRSKPTETRGGVTLPSYRGDAVNGIDFTQESRTPDPSRLLRVYHASLAVLNVVRAFSSGAQPDLRESHLRNHEFVSVSPFGKHYEPLWQEIDAALEFLRSLGVVAQDQNELFTSHEALLLDYESALTRLAGEGELYALSGHMIWIGERTRQLDGAHIEFASRVQNPVGVKLSASTTPDDVLALVDKLDPARDPGRLTFIVRMGSERVRDCLPALVDKVNASGAQIVWVCDPMHGNTIEAPGGYKTRRFDQIFDEIKGFFEVHHELGTHAGGVHLELTSEEVTECLGGSDEVIEHDLPKRYESTCDPRLNRSQALDLAFAVAELYRQRR